jgi:hypothetical protein
LSDLVTLECKEFLMRRTLTALVSAALAIAWVIVSAPQAQAVTYRQYLGNGEPNHGPFEDGSFIMREGDRIQSLNGRYSLRLQTDGNMVLYDSAPSPDRVCGVSHTTGLGAIEARLQASDNNFVLYAGNSGVWASTSTHLPNLTYYRVNVANNGKAAVIVANNYTDSAFANSSFRDNFWSC